MREIPTGLHKSLHDKMHGDLGYQKLYWELDELLQGDVDQCGLEVLVDWAIAKMNFAEAHGRKMAQLYEKMHRAVACGALSPNTALRFLEREREKMYEENSDRSR